MGFLSLPHGSLIFIDANAVIYSVEKIDPYWSLLQPLWASATAGEYSLVGSELLLLETLVKPLRDRDTILETTFRNLLLASHELRLLPIDTSVLDHAARLRATTSIKTPDAIHAATPLLAGSNAFVTNDPSFRRVPGLSIIVLSEIATP